MNKIKELATQAKLLDEDGWNTTNLNVSVDKFAELIIKECVNVMEDEDNFYGTWMGDVIKEKFGIK